VSFERGQIVWVNFTPQKGHEQAGRRPALVISPGDYNALSNCILLCPITSNVAPWPWKTMLPDTLSIKGAVLVAQLKSIDAEARNVTDAQETVSPIFMAEVLARLASLTR